MLLHRVNWDFKKEGGKVKVNILITFYWRNQFIEIPVDVDEMEVKFDGVTANCYPTGSTGSYVCRVLTSPGYHVLHVWGSRYQGLWSREVTEGDLNLEFEPELNVALNFVGKTLHVFVRGSQDLDPDMIMGKLDGTLITLRRVGRGHYVSEINKGGVVEVEACYRNDCRKAVITANPTPSLRDWDPRSWLNRDLYGYHVVDLLGEGGFSYVLKATSLDRVFALKIPKLAFSPSKGITRNVSDTLGDLFKEQSALLELSEQSPYLVKLEGVHVDKETVRRAMIDPNFYLEYPPMIVMEYMEGGPVTRLVNDDAIFYSDSWKAVVFTMAQRVSSGLLKVHERGYVHCDVKPSNILLDHRPPTTATELLGELKSRHVNPKLADLGSAVKNGSTPPGATLEYASIEQVNSLFSRGVNWTDDIYSLGATLFYLLTRKYLNEPILADMEKAFSTGKKLNNSLYRKRDFTPLLNSGLDSKVTSFIREMTSERAEDRPSAVKVFNFFSSLL